MLGPGHSNHFLKLSCILANTKRKGMSFQDDRPTSGRMRGNLLHIIPSTAVALMTMRINPPLGVTILVVFLSSNQIDHLSLQELIRSF